MSDTENTHVRRLDLFKAVPPKDPNIEQEIIDTAQRAQRSRSEARRDAILAVGLAIVRRGDSLATGWTIKDADMVYVIADQLIELETKPE